MALIPLNAQEQAYIDTFGTLVKTASADGVGTVPKLQGFASLSTALQNAVRDTYQNQMGALLASIRPQWVSTGYVLGTNWALWGDPANSLGLVRFYKDVTGRVFLEGVVQAPSSPSAGSTILTLPEGYRPDSTIFCSGVSLDAFAPLSVTSAGAVVYRTTPTASAWVALNINFLA